MFIDAECNGFSCIFSIIDDISDNFPGFDNIIPTFGKSCLIVFFFCRPYNTLRDPFVFIVLNSKI